MREVRMGAEMQDFMTREPARQRAKTIAYFAAFEKRRIARSLNRFLKPSRKKK